MAIESIFHFLAVIWVAVFAALAGYFVYRQRRQPWGERLISAVVLLLIAAAGAGICYGLGAFFFEIFG